MIFENNNIEYICRLMYDSINMPIYFMDSHDNMLFSMCSKQADSPLISSKQSLFKSLFGECTSCGFPILKCTKYNENYFAINLIKDKKFLGMLVMGPCLFSPITAEEINNIIVENEIPLSLKKDIILYFNSMTTMDYSSFVSTSLILYNLIYQKILTHSMVSSKNSSLQNVMQKIKTDNNNTISENRQNLIFHHTPNRERTIFQCVKNGDKDSLIKCTSMPEDGKHGILSDNPLRSQKNLFICCVTIATRAAIEGGLDSESAYTLSDSYIKNIEYVNNSNDISSLEIEMFCNFADNVAKSKKQKYSKAIIQCESYISKHLYEDISLADLSEVTNLNPKYLSALFNKETGKTISTYIQEKRIEEAKHLLNFTDHSILDIAAWLGFHDQSHFTKIFKKHTGETPKRFRNVWR